MQDFSHNAIISSVKIEHYSGMAEKTLMKICVESKKRWQLGEIRLIHRIGTIAANEQLIFVGISAKSYKSAFSACEFIIDHLKKEVPLWKKECTVNGMKWVS